MSKEEIQVIFDDGVRKIDPDKYTLLDNDFYEKNKHKHYFLYYLYNNTFFYKSRGDSDYLKTGIYINKNTYKKMLRVYI